jgi:hypothetical protein
LKWYDEGGENHIKKIFDVEVFSPLRILTSPLFEEPLRVFLFLPFFLFLSFFLFFTILFLSFSMLRLLIFEDKNHVLKNFFSIGLTWNSMVMTVDILAVDAYSRMELCMPI